MLDDPARCYVVPSAPGKRFDGDEKVTDLLYRCYRMVELNQSHEEVFARIADRYLSIVDELGIDFDLRPILSETCDAIRRRRSVDFAASRGEYLCGIVLAKYLGRDFIDPVDVIKFDRRGAFAAEWTNEMLMRAMEDHPRAVIPGFYGSYPNGDVHTFSRGGSDVSGAIVARAAEADVYENWTDVNGFLMADPRVVDNPRTIRQLTYRELRELSYMGATVLHEEAIFPVHTARIHDANIRNTNNPEDPGHADRRPADRGELRHADHRHRRPQGLHADYDRQGDDERRIRLRPPRAAGAGGLLRRLLRAPAQPASTRCASSSRTASCPRARTRSSSASARPAGPDSIEDPESGLALIATVGYGVVQPARHRRPSCSRRCTRPTSTCVMIDQGSSELNIIVGVDTADFETAMRAIYHASCRARDPMEREEPGCDPPRAQLVNKVFLTSWWTGEQAPPPLPPPPNFARAALQRERNLPGSDFCSEKWSFPGAGIHARARRTRPIGRDLYARKGFGPLALSRVFDGDLASGAMPPRALYSCPKGGFAHENRRCDRRPSPASGANSPYEIDRREALRRDLAHRPPQGAAGGARIRAARKGAPDRAGSDRTGRASRSIGSCSPPRSPRCTRWSTTRASACSVPCTERSLDQQLKIIDLSARGARRHGVSDAALHGRSARRSTTSPRRRPSSRCRTSRSTARRRRLR